MNRLKRAFVKQFSQPKGILGELAGMVMATRASNLERNEWTIDLLGLTPTDDVLEIGPGPGVTLSKILARVTKGKVVALDHSKTMLNQCQRRNWAAVNSGQLELIEGTYSALDSNAARFDKIIAVNVLQFHRQDTEVLKRLHNILSPGGRLAITYQPRGENVSNQSGQSFAEKIRIALCSIGFSSIKIEVLPSEPVNAFCVIADK